MLQHVRQAVLQCHPVAEQTSVLQHMRSVVLVQLGVLCYIVIIDFQCV